MANDLTKLSSPRIFLIRMLVFLILCGLLAFVLQRQIFNAFLANPWLKGLIVAVLLIGIILSFHHVIRLFPEVAWVNGYRSADPKLAGRREPKLLAPMAAMLGGMGISFSSSLFGLAGSLVLGFLDLQTSQAQNRFYTNLEDWLATTVQEPGIGYVNGGTLPSGLVDALTRLQQSVGDGASGKATSAAMANLAEAIQGLVQHMRSEQQMIRDWADEQAKL